MWIDPDLLESWFGRLYAEHIRTQPDGRPGGPAVTETVAQTDIAVGAAIGVDVVFAFGNDLVNPAGTSGLGVIEILPERCRTEIQHRPPNIPKSSSLPHRSSRSWPKPQAYSSP